jgi:hypothetical protein
MNIYSKVQNGGFITNVKKNRKKICQVFIIVKKNIGWKTKLKKKIEIFLTMDEEAITYFGVCDEICTWKSFS